MRILRRVVVALALVTGAGGVTWVFTHRRAPPEQTVVAEAPSQANKLDWQTALGLKALGRLPTKEEEGVLRGPSSSMDSFTDKLVGLPQANSHAAGVLFGSMGYLGNTELAGDSYVLRSTQVGGEQIWFRYNECKLADTEQVHPWWALGTSIRVCRDSYRPDRVRDPVSGGYCGGLMTETEHSTYCGCGSNLVYCFRDQEQRRAANRSVVGEVERTTADVVARDLPLRELFLKNETIRDAYAEMRYRRSRIANGEPADRVLADLDSWDAVNGDRLTPRAEVYPGQQAGVLTTTHFLFHFMGPRLRIQGFNEALWCTEVKSQGVTAHMILALGTPDLRVGDGWKQLAEGPVCSTCHARLDWGLRFFSGYPWVALGTDFLNSEHASGVGKVFINGPDDLRATANLSAKDFAEIAVAQPEFGACMVHRVVEHVFGNAARPEDEAAVDAAFKLDGTYRGMMRAALMHWARRAVSPAARSVVGETRPMTPLSSPAVTTTASSAVDDPMMSVPASLRSALDTNCVNCHDDGSTDFRASSLPQSLLARMMLKVAVGEMPRKRKLSPAQRRGLLMEFVSSLYAGQSERDIALAYFSGDSSAPSVLSRDVVSRLVQGRSGSERTIEVDSIQPILPLAHEDGTDPIWKFTPGFALGVGASAVSACKIAGKSGAALEQCVRDSAPLASLLSVPPGR